MFDVDEVGGSAKGIVVRTLRDGPLFAEAESRLRRADSEILLQESGLSSSSGSKEVRTAARSTWNVTFKCSA